MGDSIRQLMKRANRKSYRFNRVDVQPATRMAKLRHRERRRDAGIQPLINADYAEIEARVLAHMQDDQA